MRVIARKTLVDFCKRQPAAKAEVDAWFAEAKYAKWTKPTEIKAKYGNASVLRSGRVVFNICGNRYRLVTAIHYKTGIVFVRFIGTHGEYDKINAETI